MNEFSDAKRDKRRRGSPVNTRCVCSTCRISYEKKSRESQGVNNTAQIRAGAKQSSQGHGAIASWEDTTQGAVCTKNGLNLWEIQASPPGLQTHRVMGSEAARKESKAMNETREGSV